MSNKIQILEKKQDNIYSEKINIESLGKNAEFYYLDNDIEINNYFEIQNRRYLGNKYKLLSFIEDILKEKRIGFRTFCDIFAGSGVVGHYFNKHDNIVISNDILKSNYTILKAFIGSKHFDIKNIYQKIEKLNKLVELNDNYFSLNYGGTYFTINNARKIGRIREEIDLISDSEEERCIFLTSLLYALDKVANTVGHYDAYRKKLDSIKPIKLLVPKINQNINKNNYVFNDDANYLIKNIEADVLYIDPPYNSRQYCDSYHLLENIVSWEKPILYGKAKKMNRKHLKSNYCLKDATSAFEDLINNAKCKHILLSYNNTGIKMDGRSNARISDNQILEILQAKGRVQVFEKCYKAFTTGKTVTSGHTERIFYCKVG